MKKDACENEKSRGTKTGNPPLQQAPQLHDAAQKPSCWPATTRTYARAAARDSSILTPRGGWGAVHAAVRVAPELTVRTSAIECHSR